MSTDKQTVDIVSDLAKILNAEALDEIDISISRGKTDRMSIRLVKTRGTILNETQVKHVPLQQSISDPFHVDTDEDQQVIEEVGTVKSEMVGTAFLKPSPDDDINFVKVGSTVQEGDNLLIIEAMKTMNYIQSPYSGTVMKILISDNEPVQYGTALMVIN